MKLFFVFFHQTSCIVICEGVRSTGGTKRKHQFWSHDIYDIYY